MSVFCTPDGRPFFAGTYFPPDRPPRHAGLPPGARRRWPTPGGKRPHEVEEQADALVAAVGRQDLAGRPSGRPAGRRRGGAPLRRPAGARSRPSWPTASTPSGAASARPPSSPARPWSSCACATIGRPATRRSLTMATTTLDAMAAGGIYDHLAGGFARYSTDRRWLVPHFEKMLTDQALLARAYLHAWQVDRPRRLPPGGDRDPRLRAGRPGGPGGGLCSSEDADAGGVEGGHATFTPGPGAPGPGRRRAGRPGSPAVLRLVRDHRGRQLGGDHGPPPAPRRPAGPAGRRSRRAGGCCSTPVGRRPQPALDDKVLTEWNAMAAAVLAEAAGATGNQRWADRAERDRRVPLRRAAPGRRPLAAFAGRAGRPAPGLRRRLRLGGRVLHPPGAS